jgi:hypothetical protein
MNKAEKQAMADLQTELALRWPRYEAPKRVHPTVTRYNEPLFVAWTFNAYSKEVKQGCSSGAGGRHSIRSTIKTDTQNGAPPEGWYETQIDAMKAMRVVVSKRCAEELAGIDRKIAALESAEVAAARVEVTARRNIDEER